MINISSVIYQDILTSDQLSGGLFSGFTRQQRGLIRLECHKLISAFPSMLGIFEKPSMSSAVYVSLSSPCVSQANPSCSDYVLPTLGFFLAPPFSGSHLVWSRPVGSRVGALTFFQVKLFLLCSLFRPKK